MPIRDTILFSPIGGSDPIRGNYDGPMLHILRHYKPKKAYLFLTQEMNLRDLADNRYEIAGKRVSPETEFIRIRHDKITDPQNIDILDTPYRQAFAQVIEENPDCRLIVNVTSGTPQMQSMAYLCVYSATRPITMVAVNTYKGGQNDTPSVSFHYDVANELENLVDDLQDVELENRCTEPHLESFRKAFSIKMIERFLCVYDYDAALRLFEESAQFFDEKLRYLLEGARYRTKLDSANARKAFEKSDVKFSDVFPVQSSDTMPLFEYILYLQMLCESKMILDFSRAVTPIVMKLFMALLKEKFKVDITRYCYSSKNGALKLSKDKLPQEYLEAMDRAFDAGYRDEYLSSGNLWPILDYHCDKESQASAKKSALELRDFEKKIRNSAAHELRAIDDETIRTQTGFTSGQILKKIQGLFETLYPSRVNWDSYHNMNQIILKKFRS